MSVSIINHVLNQSDKLLNPLHEYRSLLCLNGHLPDKDFFEEMALPVVAADGAANQLMSMDIKPKLVIGDLDSIEKRWLPYVSTLHRPDQNFCDFEKALHYLDSQSLLPAIVLGMNGGYLDHILNNLNLFMKTKSVFYAPPLIGWVIHAGYTQSLTLPYNTKLSLLGIPKACVTTRGLRWELNDYQICFPGKTSCFNRTISDEVFIQVQAGSVLLLVYCDMV